MAAHEQSGDALVESPQPCATCGQPAHIVMKDGRRVCARCYREEKRAEGVGVGGPLGGSGRSDPHPAQRSQSRSPKKNS